MNPPDHSISKNGTPTTSDPNGSHQSIYPRRSFANAADSSHVIIGSGARITGDISNCSVLEVHGYADGEFSAERVLIHDGGELHGRLETVDATVCGTLDGTAIIANKLDIRETGSVSGETTYGELSVEAGGSMIGSLAVAKEQQGDGTKELPTLRAVNGNGGHSETTSLLHRLVPEGEATKSHENGALPTAS